MHRILKHGPCLTVPLVQSSLYSFRTFFSWIDIWNKMTSFSCIKRTTRCHVLKYERKDWHVLPVGLNLSYTHTPTIHTYTWDQLDWEERVSEKKLSNLLRVLAPHKVPCILPDFSTGLDTPPIPNASRFGQIDMTALIACRCSEAHTPETHVDLCSWLAWGAKQTSLWLNNISF